MSKQYEISGTFSILFPLDDHKDTYEEINFLQDIVRIALEKGHIKVNRIHVQVVKESKGIPIHEKPETASQRA